MWSGAVSGGARPGEVPQGDNGEGGADGPGGPGKAAGGRAAAAAAAATAAEHGDGERGQGHPRVSFVARFDSAPPPASPRWGGGATGLLPGAAGGRA
jgi:hypothetical protein